MLLETLYLNLRRIKVFGEKVDLVLLLLQNFFKLAVETIFQGSKGFGMTPLLCRELLRTVRNLREQFIVQFR